jgi:tetratricopeptide (TPR) repeat protein
MYFPSAMFSQAAAFGYTNLTADWIWLRIIQYHGKHALSDREFKYLGHMFDILTTLSPQFTSAYTFGSLLLLSDNANAGNAFKLLDKGIRNNPQNWNIPFTKGFLYYVFIRDYREAGRWFTISSRMPHAPEMAGRFAAFAVKKGKDLQTSRVLWMELFNKTNNKTEKELALFYIAQIDREFVIKKLEELIKKYQKAENKSIASVNDLVESGYLGSIPPDPLGGKFVWDPISQNIKAVGGRKR